jgi:hypothetical protein
MTFRKPPIHGFQGTAWMWVHEQLIFWSIGMHPPQLHWHAAYGFIIEEPTIIMMMIMIIIIITIIINTVYVHCIYIYICIIVYFIICTFICPLSVENRKSWPMDPLMEHERLCIACFHGNELEPSELCGAPQWRLLVFKPQEL